MGISQADMAIAADVPLESYKKYELDKREPGAGVALALAVAAEVSLEWLVSGRGDPDGPGAAPGARLKYHSDVLRSEMRQATGKSHLVREPSADYVYLPVYDVRAAAGEPGRAIVEGEHVRDVLAFKADWIRGALNASPDDLGLAHVEGDSGEPDLRSGDLILFNRRDTMAARDGIYLIRLDDALLVKQLQRLPGGVIKVSSRNPNYAPFEISTAKLEEPSAFGIIGRVVWACRRF